MKRSIGETITLNESETKIRNLLVNYCDYYNQNVNNKVSPLELRITGGWVRDKLLGNESHDIDIAINHLTGEEFANGLQEYLKEYQPDFITNHVHTIKMNPEKSKHLETCTTKLYNMDIDFVNLRSEIYTYDSRVPTIKFGTPEEDAKRRDATLNALFYNLNENKIEDYTGVGLKDLQQGILRTPLPPIKTFLDDPLRIIRLIRFASKFNFIIENETLNAMKEPHNQEALSTKISKERIENELRKILTSKNPGYGLQLINYANLVHSIFYVPDLEKDFTKESLESCCARIPRHLLISSLIYPNFKNVILQSSKKMKHWLSKLLNNEDWMNVFWLSIISHPYSVVKPVESNTNNLNVFNNFMRLGLMSKKADITKVTAINLSDRQAIDDFIQNGNIKRSELGLYLRKFSDFSPLNLLIQSLLDCIHQVNIDHHTQTLPYPEQTQELFNDKMVNDKIKEIINNYELLFDQIDEYELNDVHLIKPTLNGTQLVKKLNKKPGPWMKTIIDEVLIWQLDNPNKSSDECFEYIKTIIE
ncbi:unnamed protein product [Candida verbasci]|uniref:CCA tRNA nucleotidyltransferase, mitochondrial n=1 Tax=Candida verbasci TaxID=1227364 RepID=A0A9W4TXE5_9ASCO|nr:unnamed protein product [Candida verbasci]